MFAREHAIGHWGLNPNGCYWALGLEPNGCYWALGFETQRLLRHLTLENLSSRHRQASGTAEGTEGKWTFAAEHGTAGHSFAGAPLQPVKVQRCEDYRAQPVVGCEMRMEREPKERMDGKMWKNQNKTKGKKSNRHEQSSKSIKKR